MIGHRRPSWGRGSARVVRIRGMAGTTTTLPWAIGARLSFGRLLRRIGRRGGGMCGLRCSGGDTSGCRGRWWRLLSGGSRFRWRSRGRRPRSLGCSRSRKSREPRKPKGRRERRAEFVFSSSSSSPRPERTIIELYMRHGRPGRGLAFQNPWASLLCGPALDRQWQSDRYARQLDSLVPRSPRLTQTPYPPQRPTDSENRTETRETTETSGRAAAPAGERQS